jgi:5'-nucleotidase
MFRGEQMIEAWNLLGLDVSTFGNHEFDFGPDLLVERMKASRFLWLSANVRDRRSGRPFGGALVHLVKEYGTVRIGLFGLTATETAVSSDAGPEVEFTEPIPAARQALSELQAQGSHLFVAVTHLPLAQDEALAKGLPLHLILGGHDHEPMAVQVGQTLITKAGADSQNLVRIDYEMDGQSRPLVRRHQMIPVTKSIPDDPAFIRLVARYASQLDSRLDQPVGRTEVALVGREALVRSQETNLGNLIADAMRERLKTDVALLNGGGIRGNRVIPLGPITLRDLNVLLPFQNLLAAVELSGATLKAILEHSVAALPVPAGRFLQASGLRVEVDPSAAPGSRVLSIEVAGAGLDPARTYTVAVPNFLATGGDGYLVLRQARRLVEPESGPAMIEALSEKIQRAGVVKPDVEGRIRFVRRGGSP